MLEGIKKLLEWVVGHDDLDELDAAYLASYIEYAKYEVDNEYVRLPTDKTGMPIHVGDEMVLPNLSRDTVRFLTLCEDKWLFNEQGWHPKACRHVSKSPEDILAEFANAVAQQGHQLGLTLPNLISGYAPRLRKAYEDET